MAEKVLETILGDEMKESFEKLSLINIKTEKKAMHCSHDGHLLPFLLK